MEEKVSFSTLSGPFKFTRMRLGIRQLHVAVTFQRIMDKVLEGLMYRVCLFYLDDIIITRTSFAENKFIFTSGEEFG